jgi:hypothetical protein
MLKLLMKIFALLMLFVSGVSNSQAQGGVWGSGCPSGSLPYGNSCAYQVNAICPSGDWAYEPNGLCRYMQTQKAECPAGSQWYAPGSESGQCLHVLGPVPNNPRNQGMPM